MEEIYGSDEANDQHLSKFLDYMLPTQLAWDDPTERRKKFVSQEQYHWVFWDKENEEKEEEIQLKIRRSLAFISFCELEDSLIQFWKAEKIRGRVYLTTSHQPFALHNLTTLPLTRYRKHCRGCKVAVSGDSEDDDDANGDLQSTITEGPIGRSFLNGLPEASPNVELYSDKEFPLRQVALDCGIKQIVALPVFQSMDRLCVGVLELLLTKERSIPLDEYISKVYRELREILSTVYPGAAQLKTPHVLQLDDYAIKEITKALRQVCNTHHLPFANSWRIYKHKVFWGSSTPRTLLVRDSILSFGEGDRFRDHCRASDSLSLNDGKGLIGKAFLSDKPCICRDVTQLSIIEYPMAHFAHKSGLKGWFAICLKTIDMGSRDYVLEFFFSRGRTFMGDVQGLLLSVLAILKQELTTFEAITGDPAENDSFTEIDKSSFDDNSESFETVPALTNDLIESPALQTDHVEVLQSTLYDPQCAKEDSINNGTDHVVGLIQSETAITHVEKQCAMKGVVDDEPQKNLTSYQELSQHSGKTLNDLSRENNINRWPNLVGLIHSPLSRPPINFESAGVMCAEECNTSAYSLKTISTIRTSTSGSMNAMCAEESNTSSYSLKTISTIRTSKSGSTNAMCAEESDTSSYSCKRIRTGSTSTRGSKNVMCAEESKTSSYSCKTISTISTSTEGEQEETEISQLDLTLALNLH